MQQGDLENARDRGYSTFEILSALAIVAVLVGAAVPVTSKVLNHRARIATREELGELARASAAFFRDTGAVPRDVAQLLADSSLENLDDLGAFGAFGGWAGPYLPVIPTDPITGRTGYEMDSWSKPYALVAEGDILVIRSPGEDHVAGTPADLEVRVDTTRILAAITLRRLDEINRAIVRYNGLHQLTEPLPADYPLLLEELTRRAFLSDSPEYAVDAWGASFVEDPATYSPVVRVRSPNL